MSASLFDTSEEKNNFTRLAWLIIDGGTYALREILLSIYPATALPTVLQKNKPLFQILKNRRKLFDYQWERLYPSSGDPPDTKTFDITLLHLLLREICVLTQPPTGWHEMPADEDTSNEAHIVRIKCFRNDLCHSISTGIPNDEFERKWATISLSLVALGVDSKEIDRLKTETIDHDTKARIQEVMKYDWEPRMSNVEDKVQQLEGQFSCFNLQEACNSVDLSSYLPEQAQEVFGRDEEIQEATMAVQCGTNAVVLITGGPGFGKTTLARETAHKLNENGHTVLFCSLLRKKRFLEAATEMIHSCGKKGRQLPDDVEYWLKNWSKQIQSQVVFVLDNADSLLESEADRDLFLETLGAMRMLSKQNVAFVITSRKRFQHKNLSWKEVNLSPLPPDEAKELLNSRVSRTGTQMKESSEVDTIVELCGRVPLALSIVGSLLSDCTEEKIIKHLKKEPMTILDVDDISFQKAIMNSFDLLTKAEKDALVAASIFPGSFDCDAAEAVLKETLDSEALPIKTVRSLKNRSLVVDERAGSHRYQMHPLIRAFAKKIGETENPQVLLHSRELACAHFLSRLKENTRLYWGKDTCKEAIESFTADRQNFEHFLKVFGNGLETQEIATSCKKFLDSLF